MALLHCRVRDRYHYHDCRALLRMDRGTSFSMIACINRQLRIYFDQRMRETSADVLKVGQGSAQQSTTLPHLATSLAQCALCILPKRWLESSWKR